MDNWSVRCWAAWPASPLLCWAVAPKTGFLHGAPWGRGRGDFSGPFPLSPTGFILEQFSSSASSKEKFISIFSFSKVINVHYRRIWQYKKKVETKNLKYVASNVPKHLLTLYFSFPAFFFLIHASRGRKYSGCLLNSHTTK